MRTVAVLFLVWKSVEGLHSSHKPDGTKPDGECSNGEQGCLYGKKLNREKSKKTTGKDGADMKKGLGIDESQDNAKDEGEKAEDKGDNNMEESATMWFIAFFVLGVGATGALFGHLVGFGGKTITKEEHETLLLPGAYAAGLCGVHETSSKAGDKDNDCPCVIPNVIPSEAPGPNAEPRGLAGSTPTLKQLIFFREHRFLVHAHCRLLPRCHQKSDPHDQTPREPQRSSCISLWSGILHHSGAFPSPQRSDYRKNCWWLPGRSCSLSSIPYD